MPRRPLRPALLLRVLLFAAIGAAATVLVAWGCVLALPPTRPKVEWETDTSWPLHVPAEWPKPTQRMWRTEPGYRRTLWQGGRDEGDPNTGPWSFRIWVERCGLPLAALVSVRRSVSHRGESPTVLDEARWELTMPGWVRPRTLAWRSLPALPLWPGFLVDTAFWGGAAFIVWSVPGFVRRGVRRRRGRCVGCGYEMKGLAVCPECGMVGHGGRSS